MADLPIFEGSIPFAGGEHAEWRVTGSQACACDVDGIQVLAFGRIRLRDAGLAEQANAQGLGAALAAGWRQHGAQLPSRISGEYLLAVWEPGARSGLVAVDRFSTFSLFFAEQGGRLAFATRPKGVADRLSMRAEIDPRAVRAYVYFHEIPAPLSVLKGVKRLENGQALIIERGQTELLWHWQPIFVEDEPFDFERERQAFMAALRQAVAQCIDGTPREKLGCFLSGGTDSSTIAGLVTEAYGAPARTFAIAFDVSAYDESRYSRLAATHFGTDHTEYVLTPDDADRGIDVLAASYEQPFGNSSAVPTWFCSRLAHEAGVERMLGGDGGDELYGGNERYATQWLFSLYERLPGPLRSHLLEPALFGPLASTSFWPVRKARGYIEQARVPLPDRLNSKYNLLSRFGAANVFSDGMLAAAAGFDPVALEREAWGRCDANAQINRLLAYDFKFTLADNDLPKVTRMCHAAGVEVAFPMLCDAVTDHSLRLAPGQKLKRMRLRYFFREALRGFLPEEIIEKPKHGFGMPFGDWLLGQPKLAHRAEDALGSLAARGLIRESFLHELRGSVASGHAGYYGTMSWVLMMLELWLRQAEGVDSRIGAAS